MQKIRIEMTGDGDVQLVRERTIDDQDALSLFIALVKVLGEDAPKRRTRRAAGASPDDPSVTASSSSTPD